MGSPLVLIVGREITQATGVRGEAFGAGRKYSQAIQRAGGVPLILPPLELSPDRIDAVIAKIDAVVLHGGGDIDPHRYGQEPRTDELYGINERHDSSELAVVHATLTADRPLLAICRGHQILNVALGGTLIQHIGLPGHREEFHSVELEDGSRVAEAMRTASPTRCHSFHHQAIDRLGAGLRVVGRHHDGTIEAVEMDSRLWVLGVQWHPEDNAETESDQQGLFDQLIARC
ncbi:MAG: hypothetical protein RL391_1600 [Actinomycetota bacterium]